MRAMTFAGADGGMPYRWYAPPAATAPLPLVVFLHGAGERGDDNRAQLRHGVADFVGEARQGAHPCFVVAPQCPRGKWWDGDALVALVEHLAARPGVDRDRIYLTGLSMGGFATWDLLGRRPDLFAAAVPICGGGRPERAAAMVPVPVWAFHGDADRTVPVGKTREMAAAVQAAGGEVKVTEYPSVGHDSWTRTYADPAVHDWLFAQRRAAPLTLGDADRVVFLGDSITWAGDREGGYIVRLREALAARTPPLRAELLGAGISGNKVPDLLARLDQDVLVQKPTLVVVYIGINDVWHSERGNGTPKDHYEAGLRELLARIAAGGARVVLCTPTVIGEKTDGSNPLDPMLEEYAAISRRVARAAGVPLLDLRWRFLEHLRAHNEAQAEKGVLTSDRVHLNAAGNQFVADCVLGAFGLGPATAR